MFLYGFWYSPFSECDYEKGAWAAASMEQYRQWVDRYDRRSIDELIALGNLKQAKNFL